MTFTSTEMIAARDKAWEAAGHNAYFGDGFYAGALWAAAKMEEERQCKMEDNSPIGIHDYKCGHCGTFVTRTYANFCFNCGYKFIKGE